MTTGPAILAVDTNGRNLQLLTQFLGRAGYSVTGATSLDELDAVLDDGKEYDLALMDLSGFNEPVWDHCDRLNQRRIPWLGFCLAHQELAAQQEGYRHGTRGMLVKPLTVELLVHTVRGVLESNA